MGTVHAVWCDRFHSLIGSPECSAVVCELDDEHQLMFYGDAVDYDLVVTRGGHVPPVSKGGYV